MADEHSTIIPDPKFMKDVFDDSLQKGDLKKIAYLIEATYESFGFPIQVIEIEILPEWLLFTAKSTKEVAAKDLTQFEKDISLALATKSLVVLKAPLPGKDALGVYVPRVNTIGKQVDEARKAKLCMPIDGIRAWVSRKLLRMSAYFFRSVEDAYFKPSAHKYSVLAQYKKQLKPLNNEQLIEAYNKEVENTEQSWTRPYFIAAMQMSLEQRNIDYEAIAGYPSGLSLRNKVRLEGKTLCFLDNK